MRSVTAGVGDYTLPKEDLDTLAAYRQMLKKRSLGGEP